MHIFYRKKVGWYYFIFNPEKCLKMTFWIMPFVHFEAIAYLLMHIFYREKLEMVKFYFQSKKCSRKCKKCLKMTIFCHFLWEGALKLFRGILKNHYLFQIFPLYMFPTEQNLRQYYFIFRAKSFLENATENKNKFWSFLSFLGGLFRLHLLQNNNFSKCAIWSKVKNFFVSMFRSQDINHPSSFNHPMIYQICDVLMNISIQYRVYFFNISFKL